MRFEGVRLDQSRPTDGIRTFGESGREPDHAHAYTQARKAARSEERSERGASENPKTSDPPKKAVSMRLDPPCDKRQATSDPAIQRQMNIAPSPESPLKPLSRRPLPLLPAWPLRNWYLYGTFEYRPHNRAIKASVAE
jgi:hypothetical protein